MDNFNGPQSGMENDINSNYFWVYIVYIIFIYITYRQINLSLSSLHCIKQLIHIISYNSNVTANWHYLWLITVEEQASQFDQHLNIANTGTLEWNTSTIGKKEKENISFKEY